MKMTDPNNKTNRLSSLRIFLGSIRFRIATQYSLTIFGLMAVAISVIYWLISRRLNSDLFGGPIVIPGSQTTSQDDLYVARLGQIDDLADERALETLRNYSLIALGILFVLSLIVGWYISGSTLRPIRSISSVAREIQAKQDLSRRINQKGPVDELKELADTFDEMLESLEASFAQKEAALEANRNFIKESSHEIRNPLQIIRTNLQITLNDENADISDYRETIDIVSKAIDRMSVVIDDLTRSENYQVSQVDYSVVNLSTLVEELKDEFLRLAREKGIELQASAKKAEVKGDRTALKQAGANLLTNAIEAFDQSANGNMVDADRKLRISIASEQQNGSAVLLVEDNGPGIQPHDKDRLFLRGERGEGKPMGGRGLGLTIVRQVVEAHGGKVSVDSEPGEKTVFSIRLPAAL